MLFDDHYTTIEKISIAELKDRGSKFIGIAYPIKEERDVKEILQKVKKEHPQANHHCYAFRIGPDPTAFRFSDDREPSGSAGKPILGAIQSHQLSDVLVVVVRYFGGTLLGVPGLINAYRGAAQATLEAATTREKTINEKYKIAFPFEITNDVYQFLRSFPTEIKSQEFETPCKIIFELLKSLTPQLEKT
ncbi:MAG: YigZ family protein [Bacteroidetes bacterium]|nr:YigZ family protein [Bacteroidota bacterium]